MVMPISEVEGKEEKLVENNTFSTMHVVDVLFNLKISAMPESQD